MILDHVDVVVVNVVVGGVDVVVVVVTAGDVLNETRLV